MNYLRKTNIILSLFTLITIPIFYVGCLEEDEPKAPVDQLPPLTTTGENTFGCLVNGEVLIVTNSFRQTAIFQQGQLQIGASLEKGNTTESFSFNLIDPLSTGIDYNFDDQNYYAGYTYRNGDLKCIYEFTDTYQGSIRFTKIDRNNFIISGQFEFSTVTQDCDTVRITDGRFDLQYIP